MIDYFSHLGVAIAFSLAFLFCYTKMTPVEEFKLIKQGNMAAASSMVGAQFAFALTLAVNIVHNDTLLAVAAWSALSFLVQLAGHIFMHFLFRGFENHIEQDNRAVGLVTAAFSVCLGIANAASISY